MCSSRQSAALNKRSQKNLTSAAALYFERYLMLRMSITTFNFVRSVVVIVVVVIFSVFVVCQLALSVLTVINIHF